ncbi:MAG: hypothetical protein CVT48_04560 [Thermoplasmata archaeon HGW-Thermoplasmata-1]|nr:MAG: hypothetical protein CVT48_04560 [Thermoplasmata archaeon HGW-Thermoplasmata-1]
MTSSKDDLQDPARIVVVDSNAIMLSLKFRIDLESELLRLLGKHICVVPEPIAEELALIACRQGNSSSKALAKMALGMVARFEVIPSRGKGDDSVFNLAKEMGAIVATSDVALRKRCRDAGRPVIHLRGNNRMVLEGYVG